MKAKLQLVMVEDTDADAELVARNWAKAGLDVDIHLRSTAPIRGKDSTPRSSGAPMSSAYSRTMQPSRGS
jgi:hypothetical protein